MKSLILFGTFVLATQFASAQDLTWPQLVKQSELWPTQCTLKRGFDFQSGASVKAGQTVAVLSIHASAADGGNNAAVAGGQSAAEALQQFAALLENPPAGK